MRRTGITRLFCVPRRWAAGAAGAVLAGVLAACAAPPRAQGAALPAVGAADLTQQVVDTERAFATTMRTRDFAAFQAFLADDATFRSSPGVVLVGKPAVVAAWQKFFSADAPPFSWEPDAVTVHASGKMAISTGPVRDPSGRMFARFTSIWRHDAGGVWHIIADQGVDACECARDK